jgi:hypothetical protein
MSGITALFFEGKVASGGWMVIAIQKFGDPPATISHNHKDGRDLYITEVHSDHATLAMLPPGIDIAEHLGQRLVDAEQVKNAEVFKRLAIGESCELMLKPDRAPKTKHVRYRCVRVSEQPNIGEKQ